MLTSKCYTVKLKAQNKLEEKVGDILKYKIFKFTNYKKNEWFNVLVIIKCLTCSLISFFKSYYLKKIENN